LQQLLNLETKLGQNLDKEETWIGSTEGKEDLRLSVISIGAAGGSTVFEYF